MSLGSGLKHRGSPWGLAISLPRQWADWNELDPTAWPERRGKRYGLIPTILQPLTRTYLATLTDPSPEL